jgi:hypothetical protein
MGLLPLIAWYLGHGLIGGRGSLGPDATRELVFFALSTFSTALLGIGEVRHHGRLLLWAFAGQILAIVSAIFYGEFLIGDALHAATSVHFAYTISLALAGFAPIYGALTEVLIHWRYSK